MKSKSKFFKISLIIVVTLLVVFSLSSCKKKDNESKPVANPSALINKDSVVLSDSSNQSIVNVPVPVTSVPEKLEKPATTVNNDTEALKEDNTPSVSFVENKNDKTEIINPEKEAPIIPTTPTFVNASNNNNEGKNEEKKEETQAVPLSVLKEEEKQPVIFIEETIDEEKPIVSDAFTSNDINVSIEVFEDRSIFAFSEPYPSLSFVNTILDEVLNKYPMLINDVSYTFDGRTLTMSYPEGYFGNTKNEVYGYLNTLRDLVFSSHKDSTDSSGNLIRRDYQLYGKKVSILASLDSAFITSDESFTSNEINEAIEILKANFPEESKFVTYTLKEDGIELNYPTMDENYISNALDALNDLILAYTPMPLIEDFILDDTKDSEASNSEKVEVLDTNETKNSEAIAVKPLTEGGKKVSSFSVGLTMKGELDYSYPTSPFVLGFDLRGEYRINDKISAGLKIGYDLSGYLPVKGYLKYNFANPNGLYLFGEAGISIGIGGRNTGLILGGGIGYEIAILDNLNIFGEAGLNYRSNADVKFIPSISLGAKFNF